MYKFRRLVDMFIKYYEYFNVKELKFMGIRIDITLRHKDGSPLNAVEKYDIEREINKVLSSEVGNIINNVVPSYIKYKGHSSKLVGHKKSVAEVLGE